MAALNGPDPATQSAKINLNWCSKLSVKVSKKANGVRNGPPAQPPMEQRFEVISKKCNCYFSAEKVTVTNLKKYQKPFPP